MFGPVDYTCNVFKAWLVIYVTISFNVILDLLFVCVVGESLDSANIVITEPVYPDTASSGHLEMKVMCYLIYSHRSHTVSNQYHLDIGRLL